MDKQVARHAGARRYPVGAEVTRDGVSFRVWAPDHLTVKVVCDGLGEFPLSPDVEGYFVGRVPKAKPGTRYWFRLDQNDSLFPDPSSRSQPDGPHAASEVIDPDSYAWQDAEWPGIRIEGQVIYEMHIGTFTREGTWASAIAKLQHLKDVGITLIEMMPVNAFPGAFGWGYDGVDLFAPVRLYGTPDDLRHFIDAAHRLKIGVILDVVYNHFGPDGNYLDRFSKDYFTDRYKNDWGAALNFDGPNAHGMRDLIIGNAAFWIDEFHFDGLRLDATQNITDASPEHVIKALACAAREAAGDRTIVLIGENEPQHASLMRPCDENGLGLDGLWNDDLHHSIMVALTGRNEAYYEDHKGCPQELVSAAKHGFLFQGQIYAHQGKRRGMPALDIEAPAFVGFIQNHDQIANSGRGLRFQQITTPGRARAITAYLLLTPGTPMLFQGQEFFASTPFLYFADHKPDLAKLVARGRKDFLSQFPSIASAAMMEHLAKPDDPSTFEQCKLNWAEFESHSEAVALHRDLLRLRREDPIFSRQNHHQIDGAILADEAFLLRFFGEDGNERLLFVNLGRDLIRRSIADPLAAPPLGCAWSLLWSSEDPGYGGTGTPPIETPEAWHIPGHAAVVLTSRRNTD